jgi:outer membrane protein
MMKTELSISALVRVSSAIAFGFLLATAAHAEDKKPLEVVPVSTTTMTKIAVVDLQLLVADSKAGKSIRDQLEKQRNKYRSQIEKQESDLSAMEKALVAERAKLSKEDFAKKGKAFQEKVIAAQKSVQKQRAAFDAAYTKAMEKLREHVVKIVAEIAGKEGIGLVLNRQEVVLVDAKMDLTKRVLATLDARVSSIPVNI